MMNGRRMEYWDCFSSNYELRFIMSCFGEIATFGKYEKLDLFSTTEK